MSGSISGGLEIIDLKMETIDQRRQRLKRTDDGERIAGIDVLPSTDASDRAPYPTRLRVILALALVSWALVVGAIVWAVRQF